jgi:hypothetical protein
MANTDLREGTKKPKNIQKPEYYANDDDSVQNGLNRPLHWNEAVDQPKQNTHNDQSYHYL